MYKVGDIIKDSTGTYKVVKLGGSNPITGYIPTTIHSYMWIEVLNSKIINEGLIVWDYNTQGAYTLIKSMAKKKEHLPEWF